MMAALRRMPLPLALGLAAPVGATIWMIAYLVVARGHEPAQLHRVADGVWFASYALAIYGTRELAARATGLARIGAFVAMAGFALQLAMRVTDGALLAYMERDVEGRHARELLQYSLWVFDIGCWVAATGLALATRRVVFAPVAAVLAFVAFPPGPVAMWIYGAFGFEGGLFASSAMYLLLQVAMFALGLVASTELPAAGDGMEASRGLQRIGFALRMRVTVRSVLVGIVLMLSIAAVGAGSLLNFGQVMGLAANVLSVCVTLVLAHGALAVARRGVADVPRWGFAAAAGIALWAAGVAVDQLPAQYLALFGERVVTPGMLAMFDARAAGPVLQLASMNELATGMSMLVVLGTIGAFARRRGLAGLGSRATTRAAVLVAVILATLVTDYLVASAPVHELPQLPRFLVIGVYMATIIITRVIANVCGEASAAFERGPGLPTAKLVS